MTRLPPTPPHRWLPAALLALCWLPSLLCAADPVSDAPGPETTSDPNIPNEELSLMVAPLTKPELLVEADAWQQLVKAKAWEIAGALVAVKRQNQEIAIAKEAKVHAEAAGAELKELQKRVTEAENSADVDLIKKARAAARKAQEEMEAVSESVHQATEAAARLSEVEEALPEQEQESLDLASNATEQAEAAVQNAREMIGDIEEIPSLTGLSEGTGLSGTQATDRVMADPDAAEAELQAMEQAGEAMQEAATKQSQAKLDLLNEVTRLREERVLLLDNLRTVVDELESKTDAGDGETLAAIMDFRLYMRSQAGLEVDVTDTTSAWLAISGWIKSSEGGMRWAKNLARFMGVILVTWLISRLSHRILHRLTQRVDWPTLLANFLVEVVRWAVWIAGTIWALSFLEVSMAPLLAMVGAAGFIVAFAMQDSLSNFASGMMILFFRPFDVGDVVEAGGVSGKVRSMNLVSTTVQTFDNKEMIIPNNKIWGEVITNASSVQVRRVDLEFGIGYDDDLDDAQAILEKIVSDHALTLDTPEAVIRLGALADSSVNFICRPWVKTEDYWTVYWDITREVKLRFDKAGIGIPYPQQDVHLHIQDDRIVSALSETTHPPQPE